MKPLLQLQLQLLPIRCSLFFMRTFSSRIWRNSAAAMTRVCDYETPLLNDGKIAIDPGLK